MDQMQVLIAFHITFCHAVMTLGIFCSSVICDVSTKISSFVEKRYTHNAVMVDLSGFRYQPPTCCNKVSNVNVLISINLGFIFTF